MKTTRTQPALGTGSYPPENQLTNNERDMRDRVRARRRRGHSGDHDHWQAAQSPQTP